MDYAIRPIAPDELEDLLRALSLGFGSNFHPDLLEAERLVFEPERSAAAFEGDRIIGGSATCSFRVTVPGAVVPAAGLTSVSVVPTHRRRGVLTALMQAHFEDVQERGEALSLLWASEGTIYGRFGYGMATRACRAEIERAHAAFTAPHRASGRLRVVEQDEALKTFPSVYASLQPHHPGMIDWDPAWWRYSFVDLEIERQHHGLGGYTGKIHLVHESDQGPDGVLTYRFGPDWDGGSPNGTVLIEDLLAASPGAYADLWRYCLDMDLAARVKAERLRPDEPLLHLLAEPRRLRLTVSDGLWVRLVDVPAALAARRYRVDGALTVAVRDPALPRNHGTFRLEGGPEGAECRPVSGGPDLVLAAADLGAGYLGGTRLRSLAGAGRVEERTPGAVARADLMLSWDPPPWSPQTF